MRRTLCLVSSAKTNATIEKSKPTIGRAPAGAVRKSIVEMPRKMRSGRMISLPAE